ncbi:hypothetical protein Hs30E_15680 [Lactococcus hodotermopsidis]|uniref:Phage protein n=1 Tax=Pseudolactococcus hodotermopsidis TaxID=2709157 RepID=A0A6A0BGV6_9LACT|nr:hypothetical protein [Lactococcus hodotermopsidis]GFH43017.1 hypothetical protein Hs30E_15680 [Lactococcus hodotermopsidis]
MTIKRPDLFFINDDDYKSFGNIAEDFALTEYDTPYSAFKKLIALALKRNFYELVDDDDIDLTDDEKRIAMNALLNHFAVDVIEKKGCFE